MTAWLAKVWSRAICLSEKRPTTARVTVIARWAHRPSAWHDRAPRKSAGEVGSYSGPARRREHLPPPDLGSRARRGDSGRGRGAGRPPGRLRQPFVHVVARDHLECVFAEPPHVSRHPSAKADSTSNDRVEHGLHVRGRARDHARISLVAVCCSNASARRFSRSRTFRLRPSATCRRPVAGLPP